MANETTVLNLGSLSVNVSGAPLSCFPKAGAILSCAPLSDDMSYTEGLNRCAAIVISPGSGYDFTVNILANSVDHATMDGWRKLMRSTGQPLTVIAKYGAMAWNSTACGIVGNPTRTVNADGEEFLPYVLRGTFNEPTVGVLIAPPALTIDDLP